MGCDIHAYIDVDCGNNEDKIYVKGFAEVHISRDYTLFAHMAGVRDWDNELEHISEPKGLPENISWQTDYEYTLFVVDDEEYKEDLYDEHACSRSNAEKWVKSGSSEWWERQNKEHKFITHPDWHSASWLSLEELSRVHELYVSGKEDDWETQKNLLKVLDRNDPDYGKKWNDIVNNTPKIPRKPNLDLVGIIGAMKAIKAEGMTPRLIFWFDN